MNNNNNIIPYSYQMKVSLKHLIVMLQKRGYETKERIMSKVELLEEIDKIRINSPDVEKPFLVGVKDGGSLGNKEYITVFHHISSISPNATQMNLYYKIACCNEKINPEKDVVNAIILLTDRCNIEKSLRNIESLTSFDYVEFFTTKTMMFDITAHEDVPIHIRLDRQDWNSMREFIQNMHYSKEHGGMRLLNDDVAETLLSCESEEDAPSEMLERMKHLISKLQGIRRQDPVAKYHGLRLDDLVRIIRDDNNSVIYRRCVN
jgi:DNA-directed RNA polymerase subunit H (RpoH/RPB5)